jgi:hypothetical protein
MIATSNTATADVQDDIVFKMCAAAAVVDVVVVVAVVAKQIAVATKNQLLLLQCSARRCICRTVARRGDAEQGKLRNVS